MDWSKLKITKKEMMYIVFASLFAVLWFVVLLPAVIAAWGTQFAVVQFILFNLGLYSFLFIFLKSFFVDLRLHLKTSLGVMFLIIGLDTWMPEYHVTVDGQLLLGANLGVSASDYIIGLFGRTIGVGGVFLYLWTYLLFPVLFLLLSAKLLPDFLKKL